MRIPRPGARAGRTAVGVTLLIATFLALPSGPANGDPDVYPRGASQSSLENQLPGVSPLMVDNPAEGMPGFDDLPVVRSISQTEGIVTLSQHAVARRPKISITSRPVWSALYFGEFNKPIDNPTTYQPNCAFQNPCVADPFYQPPCATDDPATQWRTQYFRNPVYPLKPLKEGGAEVGVITENKINLVAFGTIPATATLTFSVPRVDGKVQPLMSHLWSRRPGGCAPRPREIPAISALVEGQITVRLSDLEVDGVPVDLGPRCQTQRPSDLYLWGDSASGLYFPNTGGPLGAFEGLHPGSLGPLKDPYYRTDNGRTIPPSSGVDVPPFANCGAGGDDLSPLVTAMASGPNNPVRARQSTLIANNRIPLEDLGLCANGGTGTCPLPAPEVPERPPLPDGEGE